MRTTNVLCSLAAALLTFGTAGSGSALDEGRLEAELAVSPPASTQGATDQFPTDTGFFDQVTVNLLTVTARIVTDSGFPLRDLEPRDLIVTVGDQELPVTAIDWYGSTREPGSEPIAGTEPEPAEHPTEHPPKHPIEALEPELEPEGRLVVIFLQNDFEPSRAVGQQKLFPGLRRLVDGLAPSDRVAVLSFFAHLKLWQDFTTDREAVKASLDRAFYPGAKPGRVEPSPGVSLLENFDEDGARNVASPVEGLEFLANALAPIPGEKDIIFFGYGFEPDRVAPMLQALRAARATTFVIDTTQADFHTLGAGLEIMAEATGGTYESSSLFPELALDRTERTMTGHYVITIDLGALPGARGKLRIQLRDKKGRVLMMPSELS